MNRKILKSIIVVVVMIVLIPILYVLFNSNHEEENLRKQDPEETKDITQKTEVFRDLPMPSDEQIIERTVSKEETKYIDEKKKEEIEEEKDVLQSEKFPSESMEPTKEKVERVEEKEIPKQVDTLSPITQTVTKTTTSTESIPFKTVKQKDSSLEKGKEVVTIDGQNGIRTFTYKETYVNGKLTSKEQVSSKVTKNHVDKVVKVGTKEKPKDTITTKTTTATESVPFKIVKKNDDSLEKGKEVVATNGQNGIRTITYKETYVNGKLSNKEKVSTKITKQPVDKVIKVGTKVAQAPKLSLSQAKTILNNSGLFSVSTDGMHYYYDPGALYPTTLMIDLNSSGIESVGYSAVAYISMGGWGDGPTLEEMIEIMGNEEEAREQIEYGKQFVKDIESAVRATANALYGSGTSQANSLYNQILKSENFYKTY